MCPQPPLSQLRLQKLCSGHQLAPHLHRRVSSCQWGAVTEPSQLRGAGAAADASRVQNMVLGGVRVYCGVSISPAGFLLEQPVAIWPYVLKVHPSLPGTLRSQSLGEDRGPLFWLGALFIVAANSPCTGDGKEGGGGRAEAQPRLTCCASSGLWANSACSF